MAGDQIGEDYSKWEDPDLPEGYARAPSRLAQKTTLSPPFWAIVLALVALAVLARLAILLARALVAWRSGRD